jgi:hypothetical protein
VEEMMNQVINDIKLIVATAKRTGMSKQEVQTELAKYKNTACYMYNMDKEDYMEYTAKALSSL